MTIIVFTFLLLYFAVLLGLFLASLHLLKGLLDGMTMLGNIKTILAFGTRFGRKPAALFLVFFLV